MRRTLTTILSAGVVALPGVGAAAAARSATTPAKPAATTNKVVTKKFFGDTVDADRWGTVQVTVTVQTTTLTIGKTKKVIRKYLDLGGQYSYHTDRSQFIMSQSLPLLRQEFLTTQSANVQLVSGATYTSEAFGQSLQSALLKANA